MLLLLQEKHTLRQCKVKCVNDTHLKTKSLERQQRVKPNSVNLH